MSLSHERLKQLQEIEDDVVNLIQCASQSMLELSKEAPSEEYVIKTTTQFLQSLEGVEKNLNEQILYLSQASTNQQHEGNIYAQEKRFDLVCKSSTAVLDKLKKLEKKKD